MFTPKGLSKLVPLLSFTLATGAADTPEAKLTDDERRQLLELLNESAVL